jgi:hypothetical protein
MWCRTSFGKWMSSSSMPIMPPSRSANTVHTLLSCGFVGAFFCNHACSHVRSEPRLCAGWRGRAGCLARPHACCMCAGTPVIGVCEEEHAGFVFRAVCLHTPTQVGTCARTGAARHGRNSMQPLHAHNHSEKHAMHMH